MEGQSLACLCGPCWVLGLEVAAGADHGLLHPADEDGLHVDHGGGQIHCAGLVCVGP